MMVRVVRGQELLIKSRVITGYATRGEGNSKQVERFFSIKVRAQHTHRHTLSHAYACAHLHITHTRSRIYTYICKSTYNVRDKFVGFIVNTKYNKLKRNS